MSIELPPDNNHLSWTALDFNKLPYKRVESIKEIDFGDSQIFSVPLKEIKRIGLQKFDILFGREDSGKFTLQIGNEFSIDCEHRYYFPIRQLFGYRYDITNTDDDCRFLVGFYGNCEHSLFKIRLDRWGGIGKEELSGKTSSEVKEYLRNTYGKNVYMISDGSIAHRYV